MIETHPFAKFVAILGRGKTLTRSLTLDEAREAMRLILEGEVRPEQLGAFLMLLRVKEESPEEIAGFTLAARDRITVPAAMPPVDLDWSSYAGKRRQLPWYLLAALTLSQSGIRVFMHGTEGHTPGRLYTRGTLEALGLPVARDMDEAAAHMAAHCFAYVPLEVLEPRLKAMIELRPVLGLRSPVHTFARMLNPAGATCMIQGIFHPSYMAIHQGAALALGEQRLAVFRGEGGEVERRPNKPCEVRTVRSGETAVERWPPLLPEPRKAPDEAMRIGDLVAVWRGERADAYAEATITGTLAIALKALGRAETLEEAEALGARLWRERDRTRLALAA